MSKLTKTEWQTTRERWEHSKKQGFQWLADEIGVSRPAVSKRAKIENWTKQVTQKVTLIENDINEPEQHIVPTHKLIGRPTNHQESYVHWAYQLCFLGATDQQLAQAFNVSEQTINTWKKKYPDFLESINRAKSYADAHVAHSLYKSAVGDYLIVETREVKQGVILKATRTVLPNFNAQRYWLRNRQPKLWGK
ncbi:MAG: hypothetical protein EXR80_05395 [Methylococcales bacterium]|nr:hypothetical protein [Methylococcales bacterium]